MVLPAVLAVLLVAPAAGERPPLGTLGRAGVATAAFGLVFTGGGLALALRRPTPLQGDPSRSFDTRPVGHAFLALGGAALIAGLSLLATDRVRARRNVRVTLFGAGLGVLGRF